MFWLGFMYAINGLSFVLSKISLSFGEPFFLIALRMIGSGLLIFAYHTFVMRSAWHIRPADIPAFFKTMIFFVCLAFMPSAWAMKFITASKSVMIFSSVSFISAFFSYIFYRERLSWSQIAGLCIGFSSLVPVVIAKSDPQEIGATLFSVSFPELVMFLGVVASAYALFLVKDLIKRGYHPNIINGITMTAGGFVALGISLPIEGLIPFSDGGMVAITMIPLIITTAAIFSLQGWLMGHYSITFIAFASFLRPVFGSFFGWLLRGEQITWHYGLSLVLTIVGLYLFYQHEMRAEQEKLS